MAHARKIGKLLNTALAMALGVSAVALAAQAGPAAPVKERILSDRFPEKPSLAPTVSIPLDPLGFAAPGAIYLGASNALASLDFLDEDHLLFTFRVPGLIRRDPASGATSYARRIRAVILALPQGTGTAQIVAESLWTVHDRARYLWPLAHGHFLLRDRNHLLEGDGTLQLKPYLDFPGSLLWIELDPSQQFLVTISDEPVEATAKPGSSASPQAAATAADSSEEEDDPAPERVPNLVLRILRRDTGKAILVSRIDSAVHPPIDAEGYLENRRGQGTGWMLELNDFTGGSRILGGVESTCYPNDHFVAAHEMLLEGCGPEGATKLVAMTTEGRTLWITQAPANEVWPQLAVAANGSRLAWMTLDSSHAVNPFAPLSAEDVKEQSVTIFDAATGEIPLVAPLSPIFDAGGNVALSPSGRRVALLNAGAIQVFDLPPVPPAPGADAPASH